MTRLAPIVLALTCCACMTTSEAEAPPRVEFTVESEFGEESGWVGPYLDAVSERLVHWMNNPDVAPPRTINVILERDPDAQMLSGWASGMEIGFRSDQWPEEGFRLWILTHELANLFAAHYAGHGGFPSDWWSNGRSPFPIYVCGLVLKDLGYEESASMVRATFAPEPDHELYWALDARFGFAIFARTLRLLRDDDIDLGEIEPPWPHPSQVRSAYTIAYLSMAAGENLTQDVLSFGIGRKPHDWDEIHADIPFEEYTVSEDEVQEIQRARARLFQNDAPEEARALFRAGKWREAMSLVREARLD